MTHGPQAVVELIDDAGWTYPVSKNRLIREYPLKNLSIDEKGNSIMLGELLSDVEAERFEDEDDVLETLEPAFNAERDRRRVGLLGKLKQFFLGTYTR